MAEISAFTALRYNTGKVRLGDVVTQPYDKITPKMQDEYYNASPYNLVRIILGRPEGPESEDNNRYTQAAHFLKSWRQNAILAPDSSPSIYAYSQRFLIPGTSQTAERRGFISVGKLYDYEENVVFRHEQTLAKPKSDRLNLLRATHAHFGQIFMLYSDPAQTIDSLLFDDDGYEWQEVTDEYEVLHRVRRVSDPGLQNFDQAQFVKKAGELYDIKELGDVDIFQATELLADSGKKAISFIAATKAGNLLLVAKPESATKIPADYSSRQRKLDVVHLHSLLLDRTLGISREQVTNQQHIRYLRAADEAVKSVKADPEVNVAFLMNPVSIEQVQEIAFAGEVLPQKSTDFFPKLLSGLTIYSLDGC